MVLESASLLANLQELAPDFQNKEALCLAEFC
jgi:hypothetical protein